jgi:hypothetical protein
LKILPTVLASLNHPHIDATKILPEMVEAIAERVAHFQREE